MKKSISIKLTFLIGTLLLLTLIVGLVAFFQTQYVNKKVKQIADVDHNRSVTAYQMEINIVGTSFAVLRYLHEHDSSLLITLKKEETGFSAFQQNYNKIIQTQETKDIGVQVQNALSKFIELSKKLIHEEDSQREKIQKLQDNLNQLNSFLEEKIQDSIKQFDVNRYKKLKAALKMQVSVNHINKNLENYLRTGDEKYKNLIIENQKKFQKKINVYLSYTHSGKKYQWLAIAQNKFNQTIDLSISIIHIEQIKKLYLRNFEATQKQLVLLLEKQILILTQKDLIRAKEDALIASRASVTTIIAILSVGLLFGVVTSILLTKHITKPLKQLLLLTNIVAKGDYTQKVIIESEDELGKLGNSFNTMVNELESAKQKQSELLVRLKKSNAELDDFAYIVSHDLKAPLRAINSISEWIIQDYNDKLDENGKEQLSLLQKRIIRMRNLIDGILKYSRVGRKEEEKKCVSIGTLLNEIIHFLNIPANIKINIKGSMPSLFFEKIHIQQVFTNLIDNAIKYMDKENGIINIECIEDAEFYTFSVSDNGPGIEEKNHEKIFQLFQTLKPKDEKESTGVGLTIVKKIIDSIGGKIWVSSKPGEGSTFYFSIPKSKSLECKIDLTPDISVTANKN